MPGGAGAAGASACRAESRGTGVVALVAACGLFLAVAAPARAAEPAPTPSEAAAALDVAAEAFVPEPGEPPDREATAALAQLADALPALDGLARRKARALLARPTDGNADQLGDGYAPPGPVKSAPSGPGHFCVFWVDNASNRDAPSLADANGVADGDGVPDYVENIHAIAELSYGVEVGALDWAPPKPDNEDDCSPNPPGHQVDIYLKQLGNQRLFGYEASDPDPGNQGRSRYGYMVIDNDYSADEYSGYVDPLDPARVTVAHEFNHLLHVFYNSLQDLWMFETTAVWMEEQVFPEVDDYVHYVPHFARIPGTPITDARGGGGLKIYGSAVWNHWLADRYGVDVVRRAWEVSDATHPRDFTIAAFDEAIADRGGRSFSSEFVRFAAATAEWRTGHGGFPDTDQYPDVRRKGTLRRGAGRPKKLKLDHTAYRLFNVKRRQARRITLRMRAERGVRCGLALVARKGSETGGDVVSKVDFLRRGGSASVSLRRPRRFDRVTAVVVNADGRVDGFAEDDWDYVRDRSDFRARVARR